MRCLCDDAAEGIAKKRAAPELQAVALRAIAADVAELVPNPVHHPDEHAVRNGVRALDGPPGVLLRFPIFSFFVRMPTNGRWVKQNVGSLKSRQARALRIPLVPADQRSHATELRIERLEPKIAGSEVIFFVIQGIVRDVHLAVEALNLPLRSDYCRRV